MKEKDDGKLSGPFPIIPKQKRAQKKRTALLKSGSLLFVKNGYECTTAKEIATHAGVAIGTFYRYFADKRQLLMALLEDKIESLMPPEIDWLQGDPEQILSLRLKNHFEHVNRIGLHQVLSQLVYRDSDLAEVLTEVKHKIHGRIYHSLILAREKGLTWEDLDLELLSWSIMALIEKMPEMETETGKSPDFDELAMIICRMVFPPHKTIKKYN